MCPKRADNLCYTRGGLVISRMADRFRYTYANQVAFIAIVRSWWLNVTFEGDVTNPPVFAVVQESASTTCLYTSSLFAEIAEMTRFTSVARQPPFAQERTCLLRNPFTYGWLHQSGRLDSFGSAGSGFPAVLQSTAGIHS